MSPHSRSRQLLIVEPDPGHRDVLRSVAIAHAHADAVGDFHTACTRLTLRPPDLIVANLRLQTNTDGLQLAYVVASAGYETRTLVYGSQVESWVLRELRRAGVFYEPLGRIASVLPAYARADLPVLDRRHPGTLDRRMVYRGGRRASDVALTFDL